jgi:hypothetical protein
MKKRPPFKLASEPGSIGASDAVPKRAAVSRMIADEPPKRGGILAALRRSPLVGADINLGRSRKPDAGR